ncbi:hypothetical protein K466DRAFT_586928 [Polyporus arcularius HHB13444]|uniref:Uncharacterized protein n=1 Tax=Polyporus arcularius HHB13444 TaxID=1314778 RepID=A0A5C3PBU9_9APHY|nr:hypothetical protein K466DRAFT_586928 [Polyporus arcularius HHB13444]
MAPSNHTQLRAQPPTFFRRCRRRRRRPRSHPARQFVSLPTSRRRRARCSVLAARPDELSLGPCATQHALIDTGLVLDLP